MKLNQKQLEEFKKAAEPLMEFINNNCHPHVTVIVGTDKAELLEGVTVHNTDKFIND
ncbi:hypothetical protein KORDIASMS9_02701 [Kordia sp. SMS9]|uniref:hypothetical protein n=1 Tax=Kordia sp. SMS9 TaxID=2282170 RepID=UPI000E10AE3C|nr:hypothetical protein [Kordia sp. SMS9]AXG70461.1 hypothetical protein KORDIASMS9_02701 [Kordia sp. SMS9]